ncbi:hypothetical protein EDB84DRAFT_79022 [Lactarius hengduanensis]|nr:hypothetical protein EDB84DRAFT_79022 [Lactarius hengduanensis]
MAELITCLPVGAPLSTVLVVGPLGRTRAVRAIRVHLRPSHWHVPMAAAAAAAAPLPPSNGCQWYYSDTDKGRRARQRSNRAAQAARANQLAMIRRRNSLSSESTTPFGSSDSLLSGTRLLPAGRPSTSSHEGRPDIFVIRVARAVDHGEPVERVRAVLRKSDFVGQGRTMGRYVGTGTRRRKTVTWH